MKSRRQFIKNLSTVAVAGATVGYLPLVRAASNDLPETDSVVIGVYGGNWEKSIRDAGLDEFADNEGIRVQIVPGADAEWLAKLRASRGKNPPYDVLIFQPDSIQRAMSLDLLEPLTQDRIENLQYLSPSVQEKLSQEGTAYAAGFSLGQLGIAYLPDVIDTVPERWLDLWNPAYEGQLALSPLTYTSGLQFFAGLVNALGGEMANPDAIDQAFDKLGELAGTLAGFPNSAGAIQTLLERGEVGIVPFWDGRVFALQNDGLNIEFVYPKEGAVVGSANWVIARGAKNLANAYKLVNFLTSAEVQKKFSDTSFYAMNNSQIEYAPEIDEKIATGEDAYSRLVWIDYEVATPKLNEWSNRWRQTLGG